MIHTKGIQILNDLERKVGHMALPQMIRWIAGFQFMVWLLSLLSPGILDMIDFDREKILLGQVWRLFSWVFYPLNSNPLFVLIALMFLFFISDAIESAWGSFRVNVYVLATIFCLAAIGMLFGIGILLSFIFYTSIFLAFATLFPNQIIHLFAIIPIKAKWLGWADAALLIGMIASSGPAALLLGIMAFFGLFPYLIVFVPTFFQSAKASARRNRFEADAKAAGTVAFHVCSSCGATDQSHPDAEFRVSEDGEEYCEDCLAREGDS